MLWVGFVKDNVLTTSPSPHKFEFGANIVSNTSVEVSSNEQFPKDKKLLRLPLIAPVAIGIKFSLLNSKSMALNSAELTSFHSPEAILQNLKL